MFDEDRASLRDAACLIQTHKHRLGPFIAEAADVLIKRVEDDKRWEPGRPGIGGVWIVERDTNV